MIMICGTGMLPAIGFDDKPRFDAGEIGDVGRYRKLATKAPSELSLSKLPP
jgi:hypothetical protein